MPEYSDIDRTAGNIDWPAWADRVDPADRSTTAKYSVTLAQAIDDVETELVDRLGVDGWRLSTAAPHRKRDGRPYTDADPDDPAAVVRWSMDGDQYCVACDEYSQVRDNLRTIGLYVSEKRKMSDRPVRTGQDEFATARLPSSDDEPIAAGSADDSTEPPHEILGVAPDADPVVVESARRQLMKKYHPDTGETPDRERYMQVDKAGEVLLEDD